MKSGGAHTWYFPDGYLPVKLAGSSMEAHEAIMLLNVGLQPATVTLTLYFEERPPVRNISFEVPAERVKTIRVDHPEEIGGVEIPPMTQYSVRIVSNIPIIAQFGRLDTTQDNLAYYCAPALWEDL